MYHSRGNSGTRLSPPHVFCGPHMSTLAKVAEIAYPHPIPPKRAPLKTSHPHLASSVTHQSWKMPDIIPIVRRPVRKVAQLPGSDKPEVTNAPPRKLSIGGDSNSVQASPVKVRRPWAPPKDRSPLKEKKVVRPCDESLPPPPKTPTYNIPEFLSSSSFSTPRNPLELPVSKNRVQKTNVSYSWSRS